MLKELRFVRGAIAKREFIPAMTHFMIEDGHVKAYNGIIALCSPIDIDLNCKPKAVPMVKAISSCMETVSMHMTASGRLAIQSGPFKAFIECYEEEAPDIEPEGKEVNTNFEALYLALRKLEPFISIDASRPWSNGILLRGRSAYATNNVCLAEYWLGEDIGEDLNLPRVAIIELLRVEEPCVKMQRTENSVSFHFADGSWLRSTVLSNDWPHVEKVLEIPSNPVDIDLGMFPGLTAIKPFQDKMGRVFMKDGVLSTCANPTEGASFDLPDFPYKGIYRIEMLELLEGVATQIDFSTYPSPCMWFGENIRGAIIGMKDFSE